MYAQPQPGVGYFKLFAPHTPCLQTAAPRWTAVRRMCLRCQSQTTQPAGVESSRCGVDQVWSERSGFGVDPHASHRMAQAGMELSRCGAEQVWSRHVPRAAAPHVLWPTACRAAARQLPPPGCTRSEAAARRCLRPPASVTAPADAQSLPACKQRQWRTRCGRVCRCMNDAGREGGPRLRLWRKEEVKAWAWALERRGEKAWAWALKRRGPCWLR